MWAYGDGVLARSNDGGESWATIELALDGDEWHCTEQCVLIENNGKVWQSQIVDDTLEIRQISVLPIEMAEWSYTGDQWSNSDRSVIAVKVELDEEDSSLVVSFDAGHTWHEGPELHAYESYVTVSDSQTVVAIDDDRLFRITGDELDFEPRPSPVPGEIFRVCSPKAGTFFIDAYGYLPETPDDEQGFLVYSTDDGSTWWAMPDESMECDD